MRCYNCESELIWGGDNDLKDNEEYLIVTNLTCPNCNTYVEVYTPRKNY